MKVMEANTKANKKANTKANKKANTKDLILAPNVVMNIKVKKITMVTVGNVKL